MKLIALAGVMVAALVGCAAAPGPDGPSPSVDTSDVQSADAAAPEARPDGVVVCPYGKRPLFFVGTPEECESIRFDCPTGTHLVENDCGCGCGY